MSQNVKIVLTYCVFAFCLVAITTLMGLSVTTAQAQSATDPKSCANGRPLQYGIVSDQSSNASGYIDQLGGTATIIVIDWNKIEPTKGTYNTSEVSKIDNLVINAHGDNLEVVAKIVNTPKWARNNPELPEYKSYPSNAAAQDYKAFLEFVVQKYPVINHWIYWEQPNGCGSNKGTCGADEEHAVDYVAWLNFTYNVIKEKGGNDEYIIGGNLDFNNADTTFVYWMNKHNARYDALGIQPFTGKGTTQPLDFGKVYAAWEAQDEGNKNNRKPLWLTAWGWDLTWSGMSEAVASVYVQNALAVMYTGEYSFIEAAFYHAATDVGGRYGLRDTSGLRQHGVMYLQMATAFCDSPKDDGQIPNTNPWQACTGLPPDQKEICENGGGTNNTPAPTPNDGGGTGNTPPPTPNDGGNNGNTPPPSPNTGELVAQNLNCSLYSVEAPDGTLLAQADGKNADGNAGSLAIFVTKNPDFQFRLVGMAQDSFNLKNSKQQHCWALGKQSADYYKNGNVWKCEPKSAIETLQEDQPPNTYYAYSKTISKSYKDYKAELINSLSGSTKSYVEKNISDNGLIFAYNFYTGEKNVDAFCSSNIGFDGGRGVVFHNGKFVAQNNCATTKTGKKYSCLAYVDYTPPDLYTYNDVVAAYGSHDPNKNDTPDNMIDTENEYNPNADIDKDGDVDLFDYNSVVTYYELIL